MLFLKKSFYYIFTLSCLLACSSTSVLTSWKAQDTKKLNTYNKVVVVALLGEKYSNTRQQAEEKMVADLKANGVNAISSFAVYGPQALRNLDEKQAAQKFADDGADAAITIVLLDRKKEKYYTPGSVTYYPYPGYYNHFWGYYSMMYDRVYTPGYYTTTVDYFLETNLYRLKDDRLEYSIQTRTEDPANAAVMGNEVSSAVVKDMTKKGLL